MDIIDHCVVFALWAWAFAERGEGDDLASEKNAKEPRFDERDSMLSRMARVPGSRQYLDYYQNRPELEAQDNRLRNLPLFLAPGGRYFDPVIAKATEKLFAAIDEITNDEIRTVNLVRQLDEAADIGAAIRQAVIELGAVAVGFCRLNPDQVYSHKGRLDADYGQVVELDHPYVIVFLVEMDFDAMQAAPLALTVRESALQYLRAAQIGKQVEAALRKLGYKAKAHFDAHYDVILPPLAVAAGLGEIGRNNILIAEGYGSRVRIGAVTTDITLRPDTPINLGVDHFCHVCKKCAKNCPPRALTLGEKENVRGIAIWPTQAERCYQQWRTGGTDCGICMATCPFSHKNNTFHNLVRWMVKSFPFAHRALVFFDDLIFGRTWKPHQHR